MCQTLEIEGNHLWFSHIIDWVIGHRVPPSFYAQPLKNPFIISIAGAKILAEALLSERFIAIESNAPQGSERLHEHVIRHDYGLSIVVGIEEKNPVFRRVDIRNRVGVVTDEFYALWGNVYRSGDIHIYPWVVCVESALYFSLKSLCLLIVVFTRLGEMQNSFSLAAVCR